MIELEAKGAKSPLRAVKFTNSVNVLFNRNRSDGGSLSPGRKSSPRRVKKLVEVRHHKRGVNSERAQSLGKNGGQANSQQFASRLKAYSSYAEDDDDDEIPDMVITEPPALELKNVWGLFIEESYRRKHTNPMIKQIRRQPIFEYMTVMVLENHGIERIFEYLKPCTSLISLYLKGNRIITRDLVEIQHLTKLRHIDLSSNGIHFLPDPDKLQKVACIEYMQLHENLLVGWRQLENLTCLKRLRHITLQGNPSAKILGYRQFLIDNLPQLRSLDDYIVMDFERKDIKTMFPAENIKKDKLAQLYRFRPFNLETTSWKPVNLTLPEPKPVINKDDVPTTVAKADSFSMSCEHDFVEKHLETLSYELRRKFEYCSPILTVQKTAKMFITRKKYLKKQRMTKLLVWSLNRWNKRSHLYTFRSKLGLTASLLKLIGIIRMIQRQFRAWRRRKALCLFMATRGQTIYRMKKVQNRTLEYALGLSRSNQDCQVRTLLFKKTQIQMLQNLGLIKQAISIRDSDRFALKKGVNTDVVEIRRSILMNLVISSYRCVRVIRAHSLFAHSILAAIDRSKRTPIHLKLNERLDEAVVPVQEAAQNMKSRHMVDSPSPKQNQEGMGMKPRKPQWKRMNKFIKPSLEPSKAHHKNKDERSSIAKVLSAPIIDDNTALVEVTFQGDLEVAVVLSTIASYNRRHDDVVQIFYGAFLRRYEAILIMQRWFKGVLFRRRLKPIFTERNKKFVLIRSLVDKQFTVENTLYSHYVLISRVSRMIQRSFRRWRLRIRLSCLANIANYAARINSNEIYIEQTAYCHLETIFKRATGAPWRPKLEVKDDKEQVRSVEREKRSTVRMKKAKVNLKKKAEVSTHIDTAQTLLERRFRFEVSTKTHKVGIAFNKKVDHSGRYQTSNLPRWFQQKVNTEIRILPQVKRQVQASAQPQTRFTNNILSLIHMQPHAVNEGAPVVVSVTDIRMALVRYDMQKSKFVKLTLSSVEEAKNRAIVLALLTCNLRLGSSSFVRFYTEKDFQSRKSSERASRQIKQVWADHDIFDNDTETFLEPDYVLNTQPHSGIIKKRDEPFVTLLRARPKDKKSKQKFERFIVLGDADPKHIEETLGSAMVYNEVLNQLKPSQTPAPESELFSSNEVDLEFKYKGRQSQARQSKLQRKGGAESAVAFQTDKDGSVQIARLSKDPNRNANVSQIASSSKLLTPAEIAQQKHKWKQNNDKTYKVEVLNNKLHYIQKMIAMNQTRDPGFKTTFVQELIPLLRKQAFKVSQLEQKVQVKEKQALTASKHQNQQMFDQQALTPAEEKAHVNHMRRNTFTFEVPRKVEAEGGESSQQRTSGGASTPESEEQVEEQIKRLFKEYKQQKQAYRNAVRVSMLSNNHLTVSKKLERKIWKDQATPSPQHQEFESDERLVNIKVASTEKADFSRKDNELVLKRFANLVDEDRGQIEDSFKKIIEKESTPAMRKMNLLTQTQRFMKEIKKAESKEMSKNFVNKSNSLVNLHKKSQKESSIETQKGQKKKTTFKIKSPKRLLRISFPSKSPTERDSLVIDNIKSGDSIRIADTNSAGAKKEATTNVHQHNGSAQKGTTGLKVESSFFRRDSNVQRLELRATNFEHGPSSQLHNQSMQSIVSYERDAFSKPQLDRARFNSDLENTLQNLAKNEIKQASQNSETFRATQPSAQISKLLQRDSKELRHTDGFKIPLVGYGHRKSSEVVPQEKVLKLKQSGSLKVFDRRHSDKRLIQNKTTQIRQNLNRSIQTIEAAEKQNETVDFLKRSNVNSNSEIAREKASAIMAEIKDQERAREIASFRATQNSLSQAQLRPNNQLKAMIPQKTRNGSKEPMFANRNPVKDKLQAIIDRKNKEVQQLNSRLQTERQISTKPLKQMGRSMTQKNLNLTTIETIMRLRKLREDDKKQILNTSQAMPEHGLQTYFVEGEVLRSQRDLVRAESPFTYELNDLQTPHKDLVGKSRTRSINQFNRSKKKRVLSFLPTLTKRQSPGRFAQLF